MNISVDDYVGLTKKNFTVYYNFNLLNEDDKKNDIFLLYTILDRVNTLSEFDNDPDKSKLKGAELGSTTSI
jgi:hypothetical protein